MKNDPTYEFGNKMAGLLLEIGDLEGALKEAQASGDGPLAEKISKQLAVLERESNALIDQQEREQGAKR